MPKFRRDKDLFLDIDLARMAAIQKKVSIPKSLSECQIDECGVTFQSGLTVLWDILGFGKLCRVDALFTEFIEHYLALPFRDDARKLGVSGGPFKYEPGNPKWFFKESAKKDLFQIWVDQLATGANSFVL